MLDHLKARTATISVMVGVLIVDQLSKWWAQIQLEDGPIDIGAGVSFRLVYNPGAAFSSGQGLGWLFGVLSIFAAVFIVATTGPKADRCESSLLGAVAGGALGNLADRIFRARTGVLSGEVVDFVDLGFWPVFNVADVAIVVGLAGYLIKSFRESGSAKQDVD